MIMRAILKTTAVASVALATLFTSCSKDDDNNTTTTPSTYTIPSTYTFKREGKNTVSFSGQTERKNQLTEMVAILKKGNKGEQVDAQMLKDMFSNKDDNGGGHFGFTSTKQLKSKVIEGPVATMIEGWMDGIEAASKSGKPGSNGQAGVLTGATGEKGPYLMNEKGMEYAQLIEKSIMGSVFMYQITQVYLGNKKLDVDNTKSVDKAAGKYYTEKEHHWDEAFGYFTDGVDFPVSGTSRFLGKYVNGRNDILKSGDKIMAAFLKGRAAVTNKDDKAVEESREIIRKEMEIVFVATAIHYLNDAIADIGKDVNRNHFLSEAWAFANSIKYAYMPKMSNAQVDEVLGLMGDNFYEAEAGKLKEAKDKLSAAYGLDSYKDKL